MIGKIALGLLVATPLSAPAAAHAQPLSASEIAARQANIAWHENAAAVNRYDGGVYVELAQAYQQAGRTIDAMNAYRRVMKLNNVMMETRNGDPVWSHEVAKAMLAHEVSLAAR